MSSSRVISLIFWLLSCTNRRALCLNCTSILRRCCSDIGAPPDKIYYLFLVSEISGQDKILSSSIWSSPALKRINSFFILSVYYFLMQSSVYLFTIQERFSSLHRSKDTFTDEHSLWKELAPWMGIKLKGRGRNKEDTRFVRWKMMHMERLKIFIDRYIYFKQQHKNNTPTKKQNIAFQLEDHSSHPGMILFFLFVVLSIILLFNDLLHWLTSVIVVKALGII